jgi:predicted transposase/invertase (TIGR01784 family)
LQGAEAKGRAEGRAEERISNARKMKAKGIPVEDIADITGLKEEEIALL